jgi:hypothetical protein
MVCDVCMGVWCGCRNTGVYIDGHRRYLLCGCRGLWHVMLHRRCFFYGCRGLWYAMREWVGLAPPTVWVDALLNNGYCLFGVWLIGWLVPYFVLSLSQSLVSPVVYLCVPVVL